MAEIKYQIYYKTKPKIMAETTANPLISFFVETFQRLITKSPKFFRIWKIITGIPVLIIALPDALIKLNIHLPQIFNAEVQDIVGWATSAAFIMTFLPIESKVVAVDQSGTAIKQTDTSKLPFTAIQEQKEVVKNILDTSTPTLPEVIINK